MPGLSPIRTPNATRVYNGALSVAALHGAMRIVFGSRRVTRMEWHDYEGHDKN
jgi:hypothetical protein